MKSLGQSHPIKVNSSPPPDSKRSQDTADTKRFYRKWWKDEGSGRRHRIIGLFQFKIARRGKSNLGMSDVRETDYRTKRNI
jgi:hypothetical protein